MEWVLFWLLCAVAAAIVASAKGRSGFGWFLLSLLLFGFIGLLIVGFMPSLKAVPIHGGADGMDSRERMPCPDCREMVVKGAKVCRFCGSTLAASVEPPRKEVVRAAAPQGWRRPAQAGGVTCANCGTKHQEGQKVCRCGMSLR